MLNMRELMPWSRGREPATARRFEHPLMAFQKEVDRLFDEFWRAVDLPSALRGERIDMMSPPRIDASETETEIAVRAELPGMEEKDVELTLTDNMLTIKGEKKLTKEEKERGYSYAECSYGSFERRIPLEVEVDADRVAASFKNGVLSVTLAKSPQAQKHVRRIPIGGTAEAVGAAVGEAKAA